LIKLLREEPESADVRGAVDARHPQAAHCRSLDRLHLAAMEELKLTRLITLDEIQGKAAKALHYEVLYPGRH
jgi:predicted nucleic acid-binding protein